MSPDHVANVDPSGSNLAPTSNGPSIIDSASSRMLKPPRRGDRSASFWVAGGVLAYVLLSAAFIGAMTRADRGWVDAMLQLMGLGDSPNHIATLLVLLAVVITLAGIASVLHDLRSMRPEEHDIDWVFLKKREGLMFVFAPPATRNELFRNDPHQLPDMNTIAVETLVDDRVRRAYTAMSRRDASKVSPEELRIIAEKRTLTYGSIARYLSSLLLLLAVLGTFAGVRTALPQLIDALSKTAGSDGGISAISAPLQAVADAFGGNALALIGAIALGLMAQGLAYGRRSLLERLELVSAEYIYSGPGISASNPLEAAVRTLNNTAEEMRSVTGSLLGIESGLEGLGGQFESSFGVLDRRLGEILDKYEGNLQDRTSSALAALHEKLADLASAVGSNAIAYNGLIDGVTNRAQETRATMVELHDANANLTRALTSIMELHTDAKANFATMEEAAVRLSKSSESVGGQLGELTDAVKQHQPALRQFDDTLANAIDRMEAIDRRGVDSWRAITGELELTLARLSSETKAHAPPAMPQTPDPAAATVIGRLEAIDERIAGSSRMVGDQLRAIAGELISAAKAQSASTSSPAPSGSPGALDSQAIGYLKTIADATSRRKLSGGLKAALVGLPLAGVVAGIGIAYLIWTLL